MKIKQVEELVGITRKNIRFYEDQGLLNVERAENGYREYHQEDVIRLQEIKLFRKMDISIEEMKLLFEKKKSLQICLEQHLKELEHRKEGLLKMQDMCERLILEHRSLESLNAEDCLEEIEQMEKEGAKFMNVNKTDVHKKKRTGAIIGAAVILTYTFMGGFLAVCTTDFVQGMLMLVGLLTVPIIAFALVSGKFAANIDHTQVAGGYDAYMNLFMNGGRPYKFVEILSQLAWGLGYCGMPHILIRFMAVKDEKELKKSSVIAISWCFLSLVAACFIGIVGRAYLVDNVLTGGQTESVFITMIERVFTKNIGIPFVGGLFLCGILAAIMSTADSQLLVCASSVSKDIYKSFIRKDADDKRIMKVTRITVIVVALIAIVIAWDPESSIMGLVSDAWAGLGSAFGPAIVLALFWKRANMPGTVVGIITGGLTVLIWDYIPLMGGKTLAVTTGIYSLLIGFILSLFVNVIVSLATKAPSAEIVAEFEKVDAYSE